MAATCMKLMVNAYKQMLAQSLFDVGAGRLAFGFGIGRLASALDISILVSVMDGNGVGVGDGRLALALDVFLWFLVLALGFWRCAFVVWLAGLFVFTLGCPRFVFWR